MASRIETLYQFELFQKMQGLPEQIVAFETETGISLPDIFDYSFHELMTTEDMIVVVGRIGCFYVVVMEKQEEITYELFENKKQFKLWSENVLEQIFQMEMTSELSEQEQTNLLKNMSIFRERIESIPEEGE